MASIHAQFQARANRNVNVPGDVVMVISAYDGDLMVLHQEFGLTIEEALTISRELKKAAEWAYEDKTKRG